MPPNLVTANPEGTVPILSLVVPCYNESEVIGQTHERLLALAPHVKPQLSTVGTRASQGPIHEHQGNQSQFCEIVYVNDGSSDNTLAILQKLADLKHDAARVRVVSFSRNFGHQAAIAAGLLHAQGEWIATIDADLQDPPEMVLTMLRHALDGGFDVVHGRRQSREGESHFKKVTAFLFYRLLNTLSGGRALNDVGDFRVMSRRVVTAINRLPERSLYLRGLLPELGYPQAIVDYDRPPRAAGETKYTLGKMMALAFEGITAVSVSPLKIGLALGALTAMACVVYLVSILVHLFIDPTYAVRGWPSLMAVILFLGAVQLLSIGILGEYIGQIHREVKHRPRFFVDDKQSRL